jgi:hypothetical protein
MGGVMPRYLTDEELPTIECCEIEYTWLEREEECLLCGEVFDWEDAESHWDPDLLEQWDQEHDEDEKDNEESDDGSWTGPNHAISEFGRKKVPKDDDDDGWTESNLFAESPQYKLFRDAYKSGTMGKGDLGKYPNVHHNHHVEPKIDIYLDLELPNEVL